jgi:hypothetical protein
MLGMRFDALLKNISSSAALLRRSVNAYAAAGPAPGNSQRAPATGNVNTPGMNGGFWAIILRASWTASGRSATVNP